MKHPKVGLVLVMLTVFTASLQGAIPSTERQALIALYNATGGAAWTNSSGWKTEPLDPTDGFAMPGTEGSWFGVTTGAGNTTVTAINLSTNNLIGSLPAAIGNLTGLVSLSLHHNNLSGPIPGQLGNLSNLQHIFLGWDQLTGSIPTELGGLTHLIDLYLQANQLNGQIPAQLGNLANLHNLHLETNQLSGSIPAALGSLANLEYLALNTNLLSGSIPIELGNLTHVEFVSLFSNDLTGSIPVELGKMTELRAIYLGLNDLTGSIPAEFGNLANLQLLFLHFNQLTGPIPAELGKLANLQSLSLDSNQLTGPIPVELGNLANLQYLYLNTNPLNCSIPVELGKLTQLTDLFLFDNQLSGSIPTELGNLASLISLYLDGNQLSGSIPSQLGNLTNLVNLSLDGNQLSGPIPPELGALSRLQTLYLNFNQLSGSIPAQLGSLADLQDLFLQANNLTGPIPVSLANLVNLDSTATDIGYNALYTSDSALIAFLNSRDPDWASTQTIAPSDMTATALDGANILVSWLPIPYTGDAGYYTLFSSETAGGPYASVGQTANKGISSLQVNGLTPGQMYYFVVRTHTDVHAGNQNAIDSEYSAEVSAVAWTQINVRVAGTILAGGSPLANVLMSGLPGSPVTNSSGVYDVSFGVGWSGTVTPSLAGYTFEPASRPYVGITADQLNQDYTATLIPPTITVISPNGGESWAASSTHNITWTQTGLTGSVTIDLYKGGVWQKTLGTASATAGTFSWVIGATEIAGTDYRVLVWQGAISDDSDASFAIVRKAKVDFNNDGQEDILWRYQGTGELQGTNWVWLMNQTGAPAPIPLGQAQVETGITGMLRTAAAGLASRTPMEAGDPRALESTKSQLSPMRERDLSVLRQRAGRWSPMGRTPMEAGDTRALESTKSQLSPMRERDLSVLRQRAGRWSPMGTEIPPVGGAREATFPGLPGMMAGAAGDGTVRIASLGVNGYLYPDTISDLDWEIAGAGDFNGDGNTDILWRNYGAGEYSGWNCVWYMNGREIIGYGYPERVLDLDWRIVGAGDFNGDGNVDILWRNYGAGEYGGWNCLWYMDGEVITGYGQGAVGIIEYGYPERVLDLDWEIAATGDFNGDGNVDILWRNYGTGEYGGWNCLWYMDGEVITGYGQGAVGIIGYGYPERVMDLGWEIAGAGDFNGDGHTDILWRNYGSGTYGGWNCIWYMDGEVITGYGQGAVGIIGYDYPGTIPDKNWRIVNR